MADPCPECGADRVLVGRVHRCRPKMGLVEVHPEFFKAVKETERAAKKSLPPSPDPAVRKARAVAALKEAVTNKDAARTKRWRENHPEKHREYMRGYMARRRGKG